MHGAPLALLVLLCTLPTIAAGGAPGDATTRRLALEKLSVVGSALFIGAHPDDENTAMLAYLAKGRKVRAAYLSLTRGDGGQNLIGTEQGDALGVIRTHELLAARGIDGAEQLFTRAVDFGYSKTPDETLRIWGHQEVLADVVWVIRNFRPDVIISRFPPGGTSGHGHHTASATLAEEAFAAAADPARFPDQLRWVQPWQARRLLWNAWRRPGQEPPAQPPSTITVDLGGYDPLLGRSWAELAAEARTMHKSQGFGSASRRGSLPNDLQHVGGVPASDDLFDGIDLTWSRFAGGGAVAKALDRAAAELDDRHPARAVPALLDALDAMDTLPASPLITTKRLELLGLVQSCLGLWLEASAPGPFVSPGERITITASAVNRSPSALRLDRIEPSVGAAKASEAALLPYNELLTRELTVELPPELPYGQPYWLIAAHGNGLHQVADQRLVGTPRDRPALHVTFVVEVAGHELAFPVPLEHRWTDPVEGELSREVVVVPPLTVHLDHSLLIFPRATALPVQATVRSHQPGASAVVRLVAPAGWKVAPEKIPVTLEKAGQEVSFTFTVTPPAQEAIGDLRAILLRSKDEPAHGLVTIEHRHIPPQTLLPPAAVRLVRLDVKRRGQQVGYIMGSGDEIPEVLRQLGYSVTLLADGELTTGDLGRYDAIVVGVRAFNTRDALARQNGRLNAYVEAGGTLVVQYNTSRGLVTDDLGPFPFKLSRDRVTDEAAPVTLLDPAHPLLTTPATISAHDFEGWVQERGLYFAESWDQRYVPLLAMADPGEEPSRGSLLVTRHGQGTYIYTSLAFFRQLPAGVPGAIRLFANLLAGGPGDG